MNLTVIPAGELTPDQVRAWADLQRADPAVDSPYFRPEFARAVAAVRSDVEVAVLEEGGAPAGFFPFQRNSRGVGRPVGGRMSDFHGVVARDGLDWDAAGLVRGCRLAAWDFDHVPAGQRPFGPHCRGTARSPFLDLSAGFAAFLAERNRSGTDLVRQVQRKARKIGREVGPLRFEYHTTDPAVFAALLGWKQAQYRRTGATDLFAFGWPVRLLERVLAEAGDGFAGVLSALYVGDRLAAVHLGMRSAAVLHSWFPAYDTDLGRYSPGLVLLLEVAQAAAARGVRRLDLGRGDEEYKTSLMSGAVPLVEGSVAVAPFTRLVRGGWYHTRDWMRRSRLAGPVRAAARATRPVREWLSSR